MIKTLTYEVDFLIQRENDIFLSLKGAHTLHPGCLCVEVWFKSNFYIAVLSKIVFIDFIIAYWNIFKDGSS